MAQRLSARLPLLYPRFDSWDTGVVCGSRLLLIFVLAPRVFLQVLGFSSLHKNQHSNCQFVIVVD